MNNPSYINFSTLNHLRVKTVCSSARGTYSVTSKYIGLERLTSESENETTG